MVAYTLSISEQKLSVAIAKDMHMYFEKHLNINKGIMHSIVLNDFYLFFSPRE